jgi:hypothetical protein
VAAFCLQETPDVRESGLEPLTHQFVSSYLLYHHLVDQGFASFQQRVLWFEPSIVDCAGKGIPAAKDSKKKNFLFSSRSGIASRNLFWLASGEDPRVFGEGNQSAPQLSESRTDPDI